MWRATILTIFPEMFPGPLGLSLAGKALASGLWALDAADIRANAEGVHRKVDDTPAGGGPGLVMKPDVLARAIDAVAADSRPRLLMSPRGAPLTQARVAALAQGLGVVLLCGRFEGVDERVIAGRGLEEVSIGDYVLAGEGGDERVIAGGGMEEVSIGDYVLAGGELPAMVLIGACLRLLPGVMGREGS